MRNARTLRRELDLWKVAWQQVETFLDQIDGARDKDDPDRRRMEGLLRLARAVEHHRARSGAADPLGDPVITRLPTRAYRPADDATETSIAAWDEKYRVWRLPGADEVELAVALLNVDDDGEANESVVLPRVRTLFHQVSATGSLSTLSLPLYPGGSVPIVTPGLIPTIEEGSRGSLFTLDERYEATMPPDGDGDDESPVRTWTSLAGTRRESSRPSSGDGAVRLSSDRNANGPPWGQVVADTVPAVLAAIAGVLASATPSAASLNALRTLAQGAQTARAPMADDVAAAKEASDDDGFSSPDVTAAIDEAVAAVVAPRDALASVVSAVGTLLSTPSSASARAKLAAAQAVLQQTPPLPPGLFGQAPEHADSVLGPELDKVVAARVEYPDGTLRSLRTMEVGFSGVWPAWRRWFVLRHRAVLAPVFRTFLGPFVGGLGALLRGGYTGFPCKGLVLLNPTPIGAQQVDLDSPASMVGMLADLVEPGHLGIVTGPRPAPLVALGVQARLGQASLHTAPLRLSMAPPGTGPGAAPGTAGTTEPGASIACLVDRALSNRELRRGRSDLGPGHDALPREALALYSQLALLVGNDNVERLLQGLPPSAPVVNRLVPVPGLPGGLSGTVPGHATTLVLHGLGSAYWSKPGQDGVPADSPLPEPRVLRPGELVLLRGRVAGDGGADGPLVQAPIEVDEVVAISGRVLETMDTSRTAVLSTNPAALPAAGPGAPPRLICGPDEPLTLVLLKRSWAREAMLKDVALTRTFVGFDAPSLAARRLLPLDLVARILGTSAPTVSGVGRGPEFAAALDILDSWTRHGQ